MTVLEPLPGASSGKADWVDYSNYWREADAEWIQDRIILRAADDTQRNTFGTTLGGVVYNVAKDRLELMGASGFRTLEMLPSTLATAETTSPNRTTISHTAAGGEGVVFSASEIGITTDSFNVLNGVFTASTNGITMKTGAKVAKWETNATHLLSDTPLSAPALVLTGTGEVLSAPGKTIAVGTLTATTVTVSGALSGGNGSSIGGVSLSSGVVSATGLQSSNGYFHGQSDSALMRYRAAGVNGTSYLQVTQANILAVGGDFYMHSLLRVQGAAGRIYHEGSGKNFAPSFYSPTDPGVALFPEGTIWIS